jgi:hypothetical protein
MCSATKACPNGSDDGSGISVLIKESINSSVGSEVSVETHKIICMCGKPHF